MFHRLVRLTVLFIVATTASACATREISAVKGGLAGAAIGGIVGLGVGGPPGALVGIGAGVAAGAGLGASQPTDDEYRSIVIHNVIAPLREPAAPMIAFVWANDERVGADLQTALEKRGWVIHRGSRRPPEARFFSGERMPDGRILVVTSDIHGSSGKFLGHTTEEALTLAIQRFEGR